MNNFLTFAKGRDEYAKSWIVILDFVTFGILISKDKKLSIKFIKNS